MKTKSITKVTLLSMFFVSAIAAVTLNSCQKEAVKPKTATTNITDNVFLSSTQLTNQLNSIAFSSTKSEKGALTPRISAGDSSACTVITIDTVSKPHTVKYDYGSGCVGSDGNTRSGVLIYSFDNDDIRVVNNTKTITMQSLSINGITYDGSISFTNTGTNANGNLVIAQSGSYTMGNGSQSATVNIDYQYEWIAGESSSPLANCQFKITGNCTASDGSGEIASTTITSPLVKNFKTAGCNYYIQGTVHTSSASKTEDLDYSSPGGCSGQVAVTENGITSLRDQK